MMDNQHIVDGQRTSADPGTKSMRADKKHTSTKSNSTLGRRRLASSSSSSVKKASVASATAPAGLSREDGHSVSSTASLEHETSLLPSNSLEEAKERTLDSISEASEFALGHTQPEHDQQTIEGGLDYDSTTKSGKVIINSATRRRHPRQEDLALGSSRVYRRNTRQRPTRETLTHQQLGQLANASLISVLSSLTAVTTSSSGSNSTITQATYDRKHGQKRRRPKERSTSRDAFVNRELTAMDAAQEGLEAHNLSSHNKDHDKFNKSQTASNVMSARAPQTDAFGQDIRDAGYMHRTYSDSGISMGTDSTRSEKGHAVVRHDSGLEAEKVPNRSASPDSDSDSSESSEEFDPDELNTDRLVLPPEVSQYLDVEEEESEDSRLREESQARQNEAEQHILQSPQAQRYATLTRSHIDAQPGPPQIPAYPSGHGHHAFGPQQVLPQHPRHAFRPISRTGSVQSQPRQPARSWHVNPGLVLEASSGAHCVRKPTGYDLVATKLSGADVGYEADEKAFPHAYRRFETLNHRVLLHLQDEIAEMEEELQRLEVVISQSDSAYASPTSSVVIDESGGAAAEVSDLKRRPASRRHDARMGLDLSERRTRLLGLIYNKLEQYNKTLAWYAETGRAYERASTDDVARYKAWMEESKPIVSQEMLFLDPKNYADLITLRNSEGRDQERDVTMQTKGLAGWMTPRLFVVMGALNVVLVMLGLARVSWTAGRMLAGLAVVGTVLVFGTAKPKQAHTPSHPVKTEETRA